MEQAHRTEELTSWQMTLKEARNVMWLRNNPEFYKPMDALLDEDPRRIGSVIFSQKSLVALMPGVRQPLGFRRPFFNPGKFLAWSG